MNHKLIRWMLIGLLAVGGLSTAARIARVIDGDTFKMADGTTVRLIGIDAPEQDEQSTRHLQELIEGKEITLQFERDRIDKYGRTLAFAILPDSADAGERMVADGFALAYLKYPCSKTDRYLSVEGEARKAGRGVWAGHFWTGIPPSQQITPTPIANPKAETGITVYITRTGTKYHRAGCRYLSKSMIPISLEEAKARYGPCSVCKPPQ